MRRVYGVVAATVDWPSGRARVHHKASVDIGALVRAVEAASQGTLHHYLVSTYRAVAGDPGQGWCQVSGCTPGTGNRLVNRR